MPHSLNNFVYKVVLTKKLNQMKKEIKYLKNYGIAIGDENLKISLADKNEFNPQPGDLVVVEDTIPYECVKITSIVKKEDIYNSTLI